MSGNFLQEPALGAVSPQQLYEADLRQEAVRIAEEEANRHRVARTMQIRHQAPNVGSAAVGGPAPKARGNREEQDGELSGRLIVLDLIGDDTEWQERALCAQTDPEAFFPEKGGSTREAKRICSGCEVKSQCLEYALGHDERFGIWGGLSERERRRLKRRAA